MIVCIGVRRGVSKGVEDGRKPPALRASRGGPPTGRKGLGVAGSGETVWSHGHPLPYAHDCMVEHYNVLRNSVRSIDRDRMFASTAS
jgi:hypothetical protein